jgi:hypothetical protein
MFPAHCELALYKYVVPVFALLRWYMDNEKESSSRSFLKKGLWQNSASPSSVLPVQFGLPESAYRVAPTHWSPTALPSGTLHSQFWNA